MIKLPIAKTVDIRLAKEKEETKPTIAARIIAGPRLLAGASVYIMTARKINASATDLLLSLTPSTFVTGTVNLLHATVRISSAAKEQRPLQPSRGSLRVAVTATNSNAKPMALTPPTSIRLFKFNLGIFFSSGTSQGNFVAERATTDIAVY